ncbi:WxL protein peptidoglycan domain-containing protein [Xylocopilactobacillus apis]|uniref:Cell surface protein n=1 Tax=Xylocopilactobacillus apis TaxID=2932183 RepID=A0AAU9D7K4_9LACO|nr:DUF916 domain-containing protein [Xylocopilactobacillus apis]BDR55650.1 cell surface protein [Xylocopilactobacillus apis]
MVTKKRKDVWLLILIILSFFLINDRVSAETGIFSVKPIFPDNQISQQNAYYLLVKPGDKQNISFYVTNLRNYTQTFEIMPGMYVNNSQGDMALTTDKKDLDPSLPVNMMDMGVKPTYLTVPANQTVKVSQVYKIPSEKFKGLIYGGIRVISGLQNSSEMKNSKKSRALINTYAQMDTGVIMTMDKNYPKGKLIVKNVTPSAAVPRPVFNIKIQNPEGTIIDSLNLKAKIKKEGFNVPNTKVSKVELSNDYYGYTVAPYSKLNLVMNIGKTRLQPGKYTLKLTGKSHGHKFNQKYNFMVSQNIANKINKDNSQISADYTWLYFIIIIGIILILIAFVIFMYFFGMKKVLHLPETNNKVQSPRSRSTNEVKNTTEVKRNRYGTSNVPKRKR